MRGSRMLVGLALSAVLLGGTTVLSPSASASMVTVACGVSATSQSASIGVGETLVIDFGVCTGITSVSTPVGAFYLNGAPTNGAVPLNGGDTLTYVSSSAGSATIVLDSATLTVTVGGTSGGEHVPGVGVPRPQDVPNQSGGVSAVSGVYSATVSWTAPTQPGEQPVSLYEVSSSLGDQRCTASAPTTSCTVKGLDPGVSYTFTVKANSVIGWGPASAPSNAVVPEGASPAVPQPGLDAYREGGNYVLIDWFNVPNPTGLPLAFDVESATCTSPCASLADMTFRGVDDIDAEFTSAHFWNILNSSAVLARVRTVFFNGQKSDWAYTPVLTRGWTFPAVTSVQSWSDAAGSRVVWTPAPDGDPWVGSYAVYASTKTSANGTASPMRLVGTSTTASIDLGVVGAADDFVQFEVHSVPSSLYTLGGMDSQGAVSARTPWRRQVDTVPPPKILDTRYGRNASDVYVKWEAGEGAGAINVIKYYVQYRNAKTGSWTDSIRIVDSGATAVFFDLTREQTDNVNGVRVRAVAWPARRMSIWAMALS